MLERIERMSPARIQGAALVLASALLVGACGGGSSSPATPAANAVSANGPAPAPAASQPNAASPAPTASQPSATPAGGAAPAPSTKPTLLDFVRKQPTTKILAEAVEVSGLAPILANTDKANRHTIFAPVDSAFNDLFKELGTTKEAFLANRDQVKAVLQYHMLLGELESDRFKFNTPIATMLPNQSFMLEGDLTNADKSVIVDARGRRTGFVSLDNDAQAGEAHLIKGVMLPKP